MSVMTTKVAEAATPQRPQYWFAILIWMAAIAASAVAVITAVS